LSDETLIAKRQGAVFWQPKISGESGWHVVTSAAPRAATRNGRLFQMGAVARQISAYTEEPTRGKRNLRPLKRPLYRYAETTEDVDGGIFAYVVGNDPELLVLVECDLTGNESAWRYRFAQSTKSTTIASINEVEVYRYDSVGGASELPTAVYFSKHGVETIPSELNAAGASE